jgi:NitT/TauT family transport system substrate-binding protein
MASGRRAIGAILVLIAFVAAAFPCAAADKVMIGTLKTPSGGAVYIAKEKGYFAAEGIDAEPVFFETAQPIAVAVVSGDIDFGTTGVTAAMYSLAGQGAMRIIGAYIREMPTFHATAYVVSNAAYAAGLRGFKDFLGHSVALPVLGSPPHYCLALLAQKYGFDLKSMRLLQLQTNANQVPAVIGGQADLGVIQITPVTPALERGELKLLGWCGDETPWQLGAVFTATRTADARGPLVERFLRAYRKGVRDFHDAFTGPDETRRDGPTAPATLDILAKYVGQDRAQLELGIAYYDAEARLDVTDILRQIDWYQSQGLLKGKVDGESLIDKRYVVPLPAK